MEKVIANILW